VHICQGAKNSSKGEVGTTTIEESVRDLMARICRSRCSVVLPCYCGHSTCPERRGKVRLIENGSCVVGNAAHGALGLAIGMRLSTHGKTSSDAAILQILVELVS
jgi:hypothetical protein